jgi:chromosome segregation ATPase
MEEYTKDQVISLQRENEDLKDLNLRLNRELRRLQLSNSKDQPRPAEVPIDDSIPPWAANAVCLSPLLLAYDNRIHELETSLDRSRQNLEELLETTKRLTNENTVLREEMERRWREMLEKEKKNLDGGFVGFGFHVEEKNELQERLDLLSTENTLLLEQLEALKKRNEYLEALAKERDETAEKYVYQYKQLNSEFKNLQILEEDVRSQKEIAEDKLKRTNERLGSLEREREQQITDINKLQNELRISQQQSQYFKKAYEEIDAKKTEEIETLVQDAHNISVREKEIINKSMIQERELEDAKEQAFHYKREFESLRSECDTMLKIMEDYEQKIANYQQKEESVNNLVRDTKQKIEEAFLERDRIVLKEQQYLKNIEKLQDTIKSQLSDQKSKYEGLLDSLKNKNKSILLSRDEEISRLQEKLNNIQISYERAQRDINTMHKDLSKAEEMLEDEQKRVNSRLNEYEKRMRDTEEARLADKRLLETQTTQLNYEKNEWDRAKKTYETANSSLLRENDNLKASSKRLKDEFKRLQSQNEDLQRENDNCIQEINAIREENYYKVEENKEKFINKINFLEKQLQEARDRQRESEEKAFELLKAQEKVSEKWKDEHMNTVGYFEKVIQDQNYEIRRLVKRNKDLGDSFPMREIPV